VQFLAPVLGAVTGGLSNMAGNKTTTSNSQSTDTSSGTSSTARNLTPYQDQLQSPLFKQITDLMSNPQGYLAPARSQARNAVNSTYSGLADTLRQKFLATGGGTSGKFGMGLQQGELSRLGDLSKSDNSYDQLAASLPITAGIPAATNLLGMNFGSTTSSSATDNSSQSGKSVGPGSVAAGVGQGGLAGLLMSLMLKPQGQGAQ
jgi:hypothetical protein